MKVGLVLGAGGVQGGAWLTGGLDALAERPAGIPATADVIVGTSAGSMIASLLAAGMPPWFMVAHSRGESFEGDARRPRRARRRGGPQRRRVFRYERGAMPLFPGSLPLVRPQPDPPALGTRRPGCSAAGCRAG